jgi:hypothetical protein
MCGDGKWMSSLEAGGCRAVAGSWKFELVEKAEDEEDKKAERKSQRAHSESDRVHEREVSVHPMPIKGKRSVPWC